MTGAPGLPDVEACTLCEKEISGEEYVVHWGSCRQCWDIHVAENLCGPTPGPWTAGEVDMFGDVNITGPENCAAIAAVVSNMRPRGQVIANARMIAMTPEFVDLLEWIAAFADVRSKDDSKVFARVNRGALRTIRDKARLAVATARPIPSAESDAPIAPDLSTPLPSGSIER